MKKRNPEPNITLDPSGSSGKDLMGDTGLNVIFGGWMTDYGKFNFIEEHANFWCSTEADEERGIERLIGVNNGKIGRDAGNKGCGFSVRYIKN